MLPRITIHATAFLIILATVGLSGCGSLEDLYGDLYGAGSGFGENNNPNTSERPSPEGTTRLAAITFSPESGFPQSQDPAEFEVAGGSITASGGTAGTLRRPGLYADDAFSWEFFASASGAITFNDLRVVAVDGYWVHPSGQSAVAIITVGFSDGSMSTVESAPVSDAGPLGQVAGFFDTVTAPEDEAIVSLTFLFDEGASNGDVATLDVLELTVRDQ